MKIAISSDNHLDVNRVDPAQALEAQAEWLLEQQVGAYFFLGDLFNDFQKTRAYFTALQARVGPQIMIRYLAGNHDQLTGVTAAQLEQRLAPEYFHQAFWDVPGTDWRIIGNNGWYDYSFSNLAVSPAAVAQWKKAYWIDGSITQAESDPVRMARVMVQVKAQLQAAQAAGKRVIFVTHFVPAAALVPPLPAHLTTPRQQRFGQMFNAMLGSQHLGALLLQTPQVKRVVSGHLHGEFAPQTLGAATYYNPAVGVRRRPGEWQRTTFMEQWAYRTLVWNLR